MLVALIELIDYRPFCSWGGLVDTPPGVTHEDMDRLYAEYQAEESDAEFCDWLILNHGCKEVPCGFAMLGDS
jgi:hypothetical protein